MRHAAQLQQVRDLVQQSFAQQTGAQVSVEETILIRNGFYCGRRFAIDGAHAIWFCEENQLKFYGADGTVMQVVQPAEVVQPAVSLLSDAA